MDKFDGGGIRKKTNNILERPLNKGRNEARINVILQLNKIVHTFSYDHNL